MTTPVSDDKRHFMFVGAHPDDVEINAGGTIHKLLREGHTVDVVILTHHLDSERMEECGLALARIGRPELFCIEAVDTEIGTELAWVIGKLDKLIKLRAPDTLITHFHADTHQDHVSCYKAVVAAGRKVKNFLMFKPTYPSGRSDLPFHPTVVSMLSVEDITAKCMALNAYVSQRTKYGEEQWADSMRAVSAGDAWTYGGEHGHAEVFQLGRAVF
jgi:LmbE family N-acetylglucosaminyl deacetylase